MNYILPILDLGEKVASAAMCVSLLILLINRLIVERRRRKYGVQGTFDWPPELLFWSVPVFIVSTLLTFGLSAAKKTIVHNSTVPVLQSLNGSSRIKINGHVVTDLSAIVSALKSLAWLPAHHSHPTTEIRIEITSSSGLLVLVLGRDSANSSEYWVFDAAHDVGIGRIVSKAFDAY